MPVRVTARLVATGEQVRALEAMARSGSRPHREVIAARGLLAAIAGDSTRRIAATLAVSEARVRRWRSRFETGGVESVGRVVT